MFLSDFATRMSRQQYEHTKPLYVKHFTRFYNQVMLSLRRYYQQPVQDFFSSRGSLQTGRSLTLLSNMPVEVTHGPGKLMNACASSICISEELVTHDPVNCLCS